SEGETLDTDRIDASYDAGVLTLRIPVSRRAAPGTACRPAPSPRSPCTDWPA
ncbi:Hsp20/alpha crystallin family protein, partial [Streptomyces sp. NPDC051132]|uniref:Hsp20/alpha crystallin family protein n=1 Tax=Streptomyces sp. NPDC051132 TaxID=3155667 RepID=UPI003423A74C